MLNDEKILVGFRQPDTENLHVLILSVGLFWLLTLAGRGLLGMITATGWSPRNIFCTRAIFLWQRYLFSTIHTPAILGQDH